MAGGKRLICESRALVEAATGIRFTVESDGETLPAFAIRHLGKTRAYVNRCAHVGVELDWVKGEFFDDSGLYLICSTHGALYLPDTGQCVQGPCKGKRLESLRVEEVDGKVYLTI